MTREEAIEVLNGIEEVHGALPEDGNEIDEALSMAIKALEQEPCEDAISRQAVHKEILVLWNSGGDKDYCMESLRDFVSELQPVKPQEPKTDENIHREREQAYMQGYEDASKKYRQEPKTGHWILSIEDWNKWTCSECGYSERTDIHVSLGYDYCPKCGARMFEPQESEDKR